MLCSGDSACHIAEKVMRSLDECLEDGQAIPVHYDTDTLILDNVKEGTRDELAKAQQQRAVKCCC